MANGQEKRVRQIQKQINQIGDLKTKIDLIDQRFFWLRLISFFGGGFIALITAVFFFGSIWVYILGLSLISFIIIVFFHRKLDVKKNKVDQTEKWLNSQLARLNLDWDNLPNPKFFEIDKSHPFGFDLNIAGEHSLLHLIDTTSTQDGANRLLEWLLYPNLDKVMIQKRQQIIQEMAALSGFRMYFKRVSTPNTKEKSTWHAENIFNWLNYAGLKPSLGRTLIILTSLSLINILFFILFLYQILPNYWIYTFLLYAGIYLFHYQTTKSLFSEAYTLGKMLSPFHAVLDFLETYPYQNNSLIQSVLQPLFQKG